jgi:cytochrome c-type biogenesis protein CcmH/NrfG
MSRPARRLLLLTLFTLAAAAGARAQLPRTNAPVEIRGQVRFRDGGAPAVNTIVRLESFRGGYIGEVITDRSGKFRFTGLTPDDYIVRVHLPGYRDAEQRVDLQRISSDYVFLTLTRDPNSLSSPTSSAATAAVGTVDASVPAPARAEYEAGRAAILDRKLEEGIARLEKAVALHPKFFEAHMILGTAYLDARKLEQSEASLRRALELRPKTTAAHFALGEVYREQKKYAEAEKVIKEGLALDDRSPEGHLTLGRVYFERNDLPAAGREVGQALRLRPDFAEAHLLAGNLYLRARRADYALASFQEYLRLAPNGEFAPQTRQLVAKIKDALSQNKKQ